MKQDAFSRYHPGVNFLFFCGAIGFSVVLQHPAYLIAGFLSAGVYYLLLSGKKGLRTLLSLLPIFVLVSAINPLFNTNGYQVLFTLFGRPYTLEALYNGMAVAGMLISTLLWFGCYNTVMTGDKFTALFGNLIPSLSLLLVMVLRLIPGLTGKAKQIQSARAAIGKGTFEGSSVKEKLQNGSSTLSALTGWALEGSVTTADSMRSRGYGTGKRTHFQLFPITIRDFAVFALLLLLLAGILLFCPTQARFVPTLRFAPLTWSYSLYWLYLLIPSILHIQEVLLWRSWKSKI